MAVFRKAKKSRISEIQQKGLYVLPGELRTLRETHLRDAIFMDKMNRRTAVPGELRNVYAGLAQADYLMHHGKNKQEVFRGGKLKKQFVEMEQDLLKTMKGPLKRTSCPSAENLIAFKNQVKKEVYLKMSPSKLDKAKLKYKELLENSPK